MSMQPVVRDVLQGEPFVFGICRQGTLAGDCTIQSCVCE